MSREMEVQKMRKSRLATILSLFTISFIATGLAYSGKMPTGKEFTNSIGITFVRIEPGSFTMGSPGYGDWDERPTHKVNITKPFYIAVTEVTNEQYETFDPQHKLWRGKRGVSKAFNEAAVFVNWHDAVNFCKWLSEKEDLAYRLPTEAEWEYVCRAGTKTHYYTGDELPKEFHKHQERDWKPVPVRIYVGKTPANKWGLYDMHGNVEEWCYDWYGPYLSDEQTDPVGYEDGDFKVTRGGSHSTDDSYLRCANRQGTLPEDKHWLIGFRLVIADFPDTEPLQRPEPSLWAKYVSQQRYDFSEGPDSTEPFFTGPEKYVKIPEDSHGPLYDNHNHQPAITACPNGDLLAIWYTTTSEKSRKLAVAASRLRRGNQEWEPASPFWDAPDRNDHGNALMWDGEDTIYHFNGLGTDATWGKLALIMRTSTDNAATWSKAKIINPIHDLRHQVIAGAFQTKQGYLICACDAVTGGSGGSAIHISKDGGKSWVDPGYGREKPEFNQGNTGAWIAGIHTGVAQLDDGRLLAFGRGDSVEGKMPQSISDDMGVTWKYSASEFQGIGGGQRLVLEKLKDGTLFLASFCHDIEVADAAGKHHKADGLYGALSFDQGKSWPVIKLLTDAKKAYKAQSTDGHDFTMSPTSAEPGGYLAATVTPNGFIHLISSWNYYKFNTAWLKEPMPVPTKN